MPVRRCATVNKSGQQKKVVKIWVKQKLYILTVTTKCFDKLQRVYFHQQFEQTG